MDVQWLSAGDQQVDGLGENLIGHQEGMCCFAFFTFYAVEHGHCFCSSRAFVQQRRVGDGQAGHVADHGLEIEQCLQTTLSNFSLVRGVLGVPTGILKNIAGNNRRGNRTIIAEADIGAENLVFGRDGFQFAQVLKL